MPAGVMCNMCGNGLSTRPSSPPATFSGRVCDVAPAALRKSRPRVFFPRQRVQVVCGATREKEEQEERVTASDAESITRKFGLEAGLWKIFTSKEENGEDRKGKKQSEARELLTRYGGAYLATSISLSLVSFGLCYLLISSGVDVASLLSKVGIQADGTGEKVGTFALAYAAHKAASPIRFPPTVALTPVVAGWLSRISKAGGEQKEE